MFQTNGLTALNTFPLKIPLLLLFLPPFFSLNSFAIDDYEIKVQIKNYDQDQLILAHYLGSVIRVDDTAFIQNDGFFVFKNNTTLDPGIFILVMPPENKYIEIFITETENKFSLIFDAKTLTKDAVFSNAPDNTLFYDYLKFMSNTSPQIDTLSRQIETSKKNQLDVGSKEQLLSQLREKVIAYQDEIIQQHPFKLTTTILKANKQVSVPKFEGTEQEIMLQQFLYRRNHFFDQVRSDTRFFRSKICYDMIQYYMEQLTMRHPDSIIRSVDIVLDLVASDTLAFQSYFYNFLNKYYQSEYMGMDAIFVHMVKEYTMKGKTGFFSEEANAKITKDALLWEKTLIGKKAPLLDMYLLDIEGTLKVKNHEDVNRRFVLKSKTNLNEINKPYTVVIFWAPDCGHCKKSMPVLVDFYEKNQDKVEVFAVCHTPFKQFPDCAVALKNYKAIKWVNTVDPYYKYIKDYDIQTTPLILLLDNDKKILLKKIAAENLATAFTQISLKK